MGKIQVVTIDSAIPIPLGDGQKYPLRTLKVGESFLIPLSKRASVQALASRYGKAEDKKFVVRKQDDSSARVWRQS